MKKYEIAALNKQELIDRLKELENRLADINFFKVIEQPQNPMVFRNSKRDIARMKNRLHQLAASETGQV
ncbi:50S ribosomal protein L29 [Pelodictyon phaeoclathratiforme]|jgi:large subunit ribosomal protein L29|uniref:Large ribosomal subunit protein uL29 n=1 Tax=Pelodictyon phaeoclathratiforme (strain DSM 5477 / BU-1) TaxID=324925 RepID=B4SBV5_PELPB|nr:50S ribosomal protein L29 [Pelodictyon phaeoclathratiforme]ACF42630.1 ribosomal protein L29 [Pelodictyon phaeoclathratiforme BU-1]MBV5289485.1 50S ribosomal protein L29 [Pelodictyon phaeoclathratiforme]